GAVFGISAAGTGFAVLKSFVSTDSNDGDGVYLASSLVQGSDGALYGTTQEGGAHNHGTVFKMNRDGNSFAILRSFGPEFSDGDGFASPSLMPALMEGRDGVLYGATEGTFYSGGGVGGQRYGTIFRLQRDGTGFAVLKTFTGAPDGAYPFANLIQGHDGALYGTTWQGGADDSGTVFRLNPDGNGYSILKSFCSCEGRFTAATLMQGTDGALYGTTEQGG